MEYKVHVYAVVRVPVEVEAETQADAISKAVDSVDWDAEFRGNQEWAEAMAYFLVDEVGDTYYERSQWHGYDTDGNIFPGVPGPTWDCAIVPYAQATKTPEAE
jgi:hypothetical protein